jgi:hypothetical protein
MPLYVGLDVSQKETEICVVDEEGRRIWRGRCPTRPESITQALQKHAPQPARVGMETGPLADRARRLGRRQASCSGPPQDVCQVHRDTSVFGIVNRASRKIGRLKGKTGMSKLSRIAQTIT